MQLGVDASGGFSMGDGFEPTVIAASITPDAACDEIADWTADALSRWGLADKLTELHGKELFADKVNEVCRMLSGRGDLRISAVVTDSQLLCSPAAVERHRARQRARAIEARALTSEGTRRQAAVLALLDDTKFRGAAYAFGATLPLVVVGALQQAFCYFRARDWREDMTEIQLLIDKEPARTVEYTSDTLLPTIGGDSRFRLTIPDEWREPPPHPLLLRAIHIDGDGLQPQELISSMEYIDSKHYPCVQVADIAAYVIRRRIADPANEQNREQLRAPAAAVGRHRRTEFRVLHDRPTT
jgi:hypothetical protein